jgi:dimethylaniline monooxygenase (N-oxide forming)
MLLLDFVCGFIFFTVQILKTDPLLACRMYFGPMTPIQFRVMGHGAWSGARETILTTWKRIQTPFQSRKVPHQNNDSTVLWMFQIAIVILVLLVLYYKL